MGYCMSYRDQFTEDASALQYDEAEYGPASYSRILWEFEKTQLAALITAFRATHTEIRYLDFACGSGRIISFVENLVSESRGIEISQSMAQRARDRVTRSEIICRDITRTDLDAEGKYDVITAFRFLLNAEPQLRQSALAALRERLRSDESVIIFNNHGNLWSHKALLYPTHAVRRRGRRLNCGNYLTHGQVMKIAADVGLRARRVNGCGLLGGRLVERYPSNLLIGIERRFAASEISRFAVNQLYVATRC
jgi:SAM-dependent methyltransferase